VETGYPMPHARPRQPTTPTSIYNRDFVWLDYANCVSAIRSVCATCGHVIYGNSGNIEKQEAEHLAACKPISSSAAS